MQIFYCILLVMTIFFIIMEIIASEDVDALVHPNSHKYHLWAYIIIFLVIGTVVIQKRKNYIQKI